MPSAVAAQATAPLSMNTPVAVEVANDVHAVALAKRRYIQPARALSSSAILRSMSSLDSERLSTSIDAGSVRVGAARSMP